MADPVTTNLVMAQPIRGSDIGTWDVPVNGNTGILDNAFGSVTILAPTNTNITLLSSQAQNAIIRLMGALTANVAIILPSIYKFWTVDNQLTNSPSSFYVALQSTSGAIQIGLPPGPQDVFYDGTTVNYRNLGRIGEYWDYAGTVVPSWVNGSTKPPYLNCNGTTFSSATYPILANLLGTNILVDSQARFRITLNQSASTPISSASGGGFTASTIGTLGGQQSITLQSSQLPANIPGSVAFTPGSAVVGTQGLGVNAGVNDVVPLGADALSGTVTINPLGGGSFAAVSPCYVGGITMIRAA